MPEFSPRLHLQPPRPETAPDPSKTCRLCGLPLGRSQIREVIGGETLNFCCPGCRQVFLLLFNSPGGISGNFRESDLYRACVEAGLIPKGPERETPGEVPGDSNAAGMSSLELNLKVEGMWCPSCAWVVEEVLRRTRGVHEAQASFPADMVFLKYLPHLVSPQEIMTGISRLGFRAVLSGEDSAISRETRGAAIRLGISAILTSHIMMISMALYFGFFQDLAARAIGYFSYPIWVMATAVVFYGGLPILRLGFAGFRYRSPSMDSLITVGALSAYVYSLFQLARGSIHLYFDTAAMLVTFVLLGRYIEEHARRRVVSGLAELYKLSHQKVRRWNSLPGGKEVWDLSKNLKPGDEFLVFGGERVPLDGRVVFGEASIDESILTGESRPVKKACGDEILGGALVLDGEVRVCTTRVGMESSLGQMIALVQEALAKKNPAELFADRVARWFVPAILITAALTGVALQLGGVPFDEALLRSLTVLLISCPCALGIATPIVKVAVMGRAREQGLVIRDPGALERTRDLDTFVFDKTGTLTEGNFSLQKIVTAGAGEEDVLPRISAVEIRSDHFLAREIVRKASEKLFGMEEVQDFESLEGMGVKGCLRGDRIFIGNRRLLEREEADLSAALDEEARTFEKQGMTVVFFGWTKEVRGFLVFGDPVRKGAAEMLRILKGRGYSLWIVSGDGQETTQAVARELGISNFLGQALPQYKAEFIKSLQRKGLRVGMVGDGINDSAALAQADVGFALGTGARILREASDFTFLGQDPAKVLDALSLSASAVRAIRQNLVFAFLYNSVGIPLAMTGLLNPIIAVLAMFASSLTVIGNALRVSKGRPSAVEQKRIGILG